MNWQFDEKSNICSHWRRNRCVGIGDWTCIHYLRSVKYDWWKYDWWKYDWWKYEYAELEPQVTVEAATVIMVMETATAMEERRQTARMEETAAMERTKRMEKTHRTS